MLGVRRNYFVLIFAAYIFKKHFLQKIVISLLEPLPLGKYWQSLDKRSGMFSGSSHKYMDNLYLLIVIPPLK